MSSVSQWSCRSLGMGALFFVYTCFVSGGLAAQDGATGYARIEEDWELVLVTPDGASGSPQISLDLAPEPDSPLAGILLLNYQDAPDFTSGGVQVQLWDGEQRLTTAGMPMPPLDVDNETISFTVFIERSGGTLRYGVKNGKCGDRINFGGGRLVVSCADRITTINRYDSNHSLENATIVLGANRVESLRLRQVRKYRADGAGIDTEPGKVVYP